MVTERDILRKVTAAKIDPSKVRAKQIMSAPLITVSLDTSISDSAKKMIENKVKRLVVMDRDGTFIGLVTMTDIIRWMAKQEELSESLVNYLIYDIP
jgi:CBS domain-containing protein